MLNKAKSTMIGDNLEIVFCIDATADMQGFIGELANSATTLYDKIVLERDLMAMSVGTVRVRVVAFRDFGVDSQPLLESPFYDVSKVGEAEALRDFLSGITAGGGGDSAQSALEAMAVAVNSNWASVAPVKRQFIIVITDGGAHPLGLKKDKEGYPLGIAGSLEELRAQIYGGVISKRAARLIAFAPNVYPWCDMWEWDNFFHTSCEEGAGCREIDVDTMVALLCNSI